MGIINIRALLGAATGPRGRPGSQRPRSRRDAQINSAVPMHRYALRAETASRSVPVTQRGPRWWQCPDAPPGFLPPRTRDENQRRFQGRHPLVPHFSANDAFVVCIRPGYHDDAGVGSRLVNPGRRMAWPGWPLWPWTPTRNDAGLERSVREIAG